jgi:hypothetical protein
MRSASVAAGRSHINTNEKNLKLGKNRLRSRPLNSRILLIARLRPFVIDPEAEKMCQILPRCKTAENEKLSGWLGPCETSVRGVLVAD